MMQVFICGLLLLLSSYTYAEDYNFFAEIKDDSEELFDSAYPQQSKTDYSILHNMFFQDETLAYLQLYRLSNQSIQP